MKDRLRCFFKTLAPVHIGCDEVYEPTGFTVDEQACRMVVFDPVVFISQLDDADRRHFSEICSKGTIVSILELYKFMRGRDIAGRTIDLCRGFVDHYLETLDLSVHKTKEVQENLNKFQIERTSFRPDDHRPYIPGSSVKGALRTAYLNNMARVKKIRTPKGKNAAKDLEKSLLDGGSFETDPFRMVKVSDFNPIGQIKTKIVYAVNEKKRPSKFKARGPYQILEVIQPGAMFEGEISVERPQTKKCISSPIDLQTLLESCTQFFRKEKNREDNELRAINLHGVNVSNDTDTFLVRLGRHSGAESVTIEGHRNIKIMLERNKKPKYMDCATTVWLASDFRKSNNNKALSPFGWGMLVPLTLENEASLIKEETAFQKRRQQELRKMEEKRKVLDFKNEQKRRRDLEERLQEEEKRREEERYKAEFEAMTPEERDLACIRKEEVALLCAPNDAKDPIPNIWPHLDAASPEHKKRLALAFKERWQKEGRWNAKKKQKKQWKKVQKIKEILGE